MSSSTSMREDQLRAYFATTPHNLRPIATSLNGDNSWLWSFPRPQAERASTGKFYYHLVFEPWLNGPTFVISPRLIRIELQQAPATTCSADVEAIVRQVEGAAGGRQQPKTQDTSGPAIDAILIGFHGPDHVHPATLLTFDKRIPIIVSKAAVTHVEKLRHFETVHTISTLDPSANAWNDSGLHPDALPAWLTPLLLPGRAMLNYSFVMIWTHADADGKEVHETLIQSPHGTPLDAGPLRAFLDSSPPTQKLAMFHGLKESRAFGIQNTFGATAGLELFRCIGGSKYWIVSHNSALRYSGLVLRAGFAADTPRTLEWALQNESQKTGGASGSKSSDIDLVQVPNGGLKVLV